MSRLIGLITANPAVLLWMALGAFLLGLSSGGAGAWWVQGLRLSAVQAEYVGFVATTKAEGEAAQKLATAAATEDKRKKENSDHDYKTTIASLNADIKRLRDARSGSRFVPAAPSGSRRVDLACFDRDELERTIREFDTTIQGLVDEGSADAVGLNVARFWAANIRKIDAK
ncbi:hypothetical protein SKTS_19510 [Sulfurimicrobium lacus]|uniref:Uncharacterized protein n=1 Tax=Sulfurimicrobium lacus TaxID=2715678 RepID=A0A6F8VE80_9PROT|nr:hypothetical protein [Sulfurimicrobium lacus]BCB27065.1 hypothetical protein SKTS_19510 [Sulfurimicrobium lacus]